MAVSACLSAQEQAARPPITALSHISVYSADAARTDYFYVHELRAIKRENPEDPAGTRYYFSNTQFVEVVPLPDDHGSNNRFHHVAFETADAEQMRLYLLENGIDVPATVQSGSDGSQWFDIADAEGNVVQFVQSAENPAPAAEDPISDHVIHVGYIAHDSEALNALYRDVLGFRPYWYGGFEPDDRTWIAQQVPDGTDWIEYMMVPRAEMADMTVERFGLLNHFALGVADIRDTVTELTVEERLSGRNAGPQIGRDGKWQFNMYDPDGTRGELMEFVPVAEPCCSEYTGPHPMH